MIWTTHPRTRRYIRGILEIFPIVGENMDPIGEKMVNGMKRTAAWKGESPLTISKRCGMMNMVEKKIIPMNTAFLSLILSDHERG